MSTDFKNAASGVAALAICESLLLALIEGKVLTSKQACGLLREAAEAHGGDPEIVALIERVAKSAFAAEPWEIPDDQRPG